jgi:glutathione peroxidase
VIGGLGLLVWLGYAVIQLQAKPASRPAAVDAKVPTLYDFTVTDIDGNPVSLSAYKGKVLLFVNTASRCGFTSQYAGLEKIYQKYHKRGFEVLAFPSNNFLRQEPGTNKEIKAFCSSRFNITFPLFAKISVRGRDQHPLYAFLTNRKLHPAFGGAIGWNFNKFLVDREGKVIARFGSRVRPESTNIVQQIEKYLNLEPAPR